MVYGNYGRINASNTTFKDPQTNILQQYNNNYTYNTVNPQSNSFAAESANNNNIMFEYGNNGSLRKRTDNALQKTEYYLFNAFDQMKAYSENGETYGYYGYDDAGQRTYKATLKNFVSRTNALGGKTLEVEKMMLYPNGYININQDGNYTKHYYADAARIASKIGNGFIDTANLYYSSTSSDSVMIKELTQLTGDTIESIDNKYDSLWLQIDSGKYEDALYFYHGNNLSSTQLITDYNGAVSQAILYAPFGQIISSYNPTDWQNGIVPEYMFQGKVLDEESGLSYFEARYLDSKYGTFNSRDKKFEDYFWLSPYCAFGNNPIIYIDPDGKKFIVPNVKIEGQKGRYNITFDGTTATMQQSGKKSSGEIMQYQSGTNKFVDNMIASYNYIVKNGADVDNAMQQIAESEDIKIYVSHASDDGYYMKGKIGIDFSKGIKVDRDDGVSGYESPAFGFWSEVYHAFIDKIDITAKNTYKKMKGEIYNSAEENYVHVTKGNQVIDLLKKNNPSNGETKRDKYENGWRGSTFKPTNMQNVTDTEPK